MDRNCSTSSRKTIGLLSGGPLALAVDDKPAGGIVRRYRDRDAIPKDNADSVTAHLASELRQNLMAIVELDPKVSAFRDQNDLAIEMN